MARGCRSEGTGGLAAQITDEVKMMRMCKAALLTALMLTVGLAAVGAELNVSTSVLARGDWTYDALSMLAARDHSAGLPSRYFQGDRLLTRVEMAELVARIVREHGTALSGAERIAVKGLTLDLRAELLAAGMSESELDRAADVPESESLPVFTGSLRARRVSNDDDDTFSVYELTTLAPAGPMSFLTGTYTNEAREFRSDEDPFPRFDKGSYKLLSPKLQLEIGRNYVRWGPGYSGSMILSDNSPAFDMVRFRKDVNFGWVFGRVLIDQFVSSFREFGNRYYVLGRRYEKTLSRQWNLAVSETAKTRETPNPSILVLPFYAYQELFIDVDPEFNTLYSLDVTYTAGRNAQVYLEGLVDDMTAPRILDRDRFRRPRKIGYLLGAYLPDPLKNGRSSLRAEYVLVDPRTYTATRTEFPDLEYTRDGLVMGHPIGANGSAVFLRGDYWLCKKAQLIVEYLNRSPRDSGVANAEDFERLDAYLAYDVRPWASLTARYVRLRNAGTDNMLMIGASITY